MRLEDLIGRQLGRYTIKRLLGRGGMAAVFEADDTVLRRPVALKILYAQYMADSGLVERFRREAIVAARLEHPHIVPIYDVGETDGIVYIAMKLLTGRSLQDELLMNSVIEPEKATVLITQLAAALDYAHQNGVIHRDIKPGNVILDAHNSVVLSDFGIAKALDSPGMTSTGVIIGTPDYMAPEQIDNKRGSVDHRADIYALGVMTYRLLTGGRPFEGSTTEVLVAHLTQPPPAPSTRNPNLPPSVDRVLNQALAKNPNDRFSSAGAFAQALKDAIGMATEVGMITPPPGAIGDVAVIPAVAAHRLVDAKTPVMTDADVERERSHAAQRRHGSNRWIFVGLMLFMVLVGSAATYAVLNERQQGITHISQQEATNVAIQATSDAASLAIATTPTLKATSTLMALSDDPTPTNGTITPSQSTTTPTAGGQNTSVPRATIVSIAPTPRPAPTKEPTLPPTSVPPTSVPATPVPPTSEPECYGPLQGGFGMVWRNNPDVAEDLGCPTLGEVAGIGSSIQYFEGGTMIYWQPNGRIYILSGNTAGSWSSLADPGGSDQPQEVAPPSRVEPVRGFGTVWRNDPTIRSTLGWGITEEFSITSVRQTFPGGTMLYSPAVGVYPARVWVLTSDGLWIVYRDPNS